MRRFESQTIVREVYAGSTCDRCGAESVPLDYSTPRVLPITFNFNGSEEDEIQLEGDICEDCYEEHAEEIAFIADRLRNLLPNASVRSPLFMDWDPTGVYAE